MAKNKDTENKNNNDKKEKKERKNVNISLQKRNIEQLNNIIQSWDDDGFNISNEICDAILFKYNLQDNPHICTILSTLNLIESSLKSQYPPLDPKANAESKNNFEQKIKNDTMDIFRKIVSINIDGEMLTSLLRGDNHALQNKCSNTTYTNPSNNVPNKSNESKSDINISNDIIENINVNKNTPNNKIQKEIRDKGEIAVSEDTTDKKYIDWRDSFPTEPSVNNKSNMNNLNNILGGFTSDTGFK